MTQDAGFVSDGHARELDWLRIEHARMLRYADALALIASPRRPDGTYNLSREACEQVAKEALG